MGRITGSWGEIFCYKISVSAREELKPGEGESEVISWMRWDEIKNHEILMPNLRVVVPLIRSGLVGWIIKDEGPLWDSDFHEFSIVAASHNKINGEPVDRSNI